MTVFDGMGRLALLSAMAIFLVAPSARAIIIDIDYTYDTSDFFNPGTPQGSAARATLDSAAGYFSEILDDTFAAITIPPTFQSSTYDTTVNWIFRQRFKDPATGEQIEITSPGVAANQYVVYAGARAMVGNTAGIGGAGGTSSGPTLIGDGRVTNSEYAHLEHVTADFLNLVELRGESGGFARWGGTISFDTSARSWHYNHLTAPGVGTTDLYSVAIHELGHALGFGEIDPTTAGTAAWESLTSGTTFTGSAAAAQYGGLVPLHSDGAHWQEGLQSTVYGTSTAQEVAMDPTILGNGRQRFTDLDAAAMKDIGWTVVPPLGLDGDYNANGIVDAADFTLWRDTLNKNVPAGTGADGDNNGNIGQGDYTMWKSNFGATAGAGGAAGIATPTVPEPGAIVTILVGSLTLLSHCCVRGENLVSQT